MAADIKKNDDFSKGPISKTVLRLAVPMVLAQFVNVLYNIVDRMYIGHISDTSVDALTGVGVTFRFYDGDGRLRIYSARAVRRCFLWRAVRHSRAAKRAKSSVSAPQT